MVVESGGPEFRSQVSNLEVVCVWASYSTSLNSSVFMNKIGVIMVPTSWNSCED